MEIVGSYEGYSIVKGDLAGKPCIGSGSLKGMLIADAGEETVERIFLHIGQKFKSEKCMDSWRPEPLGWIMELQTCFLIAGQIDGKSPPRGLMQRLAEEHAITRQLI